MYRIGGRLRNKGASLCGVNLGIPLLKYWNSNLTAEMITKAALNGDPIAIEAYEYTGKLLGEALADAVAITSPEATTSTRSMKAADRLRRHR